MLIIMIKLKTYARLEIVSVQIIVDEKPQIVILINDPVIFVLEYFVCVITAVYQLISRFFQILEQIEIEYSSQKVRYLDIVVY